MPTWQPILQQFFATPIFKSLLEIFQNLDFPPATTLSLKMEEGKGL